MSLIRRRVDRTLIYVLAWGLSRLFAGSGGKNGLDDVLRGDCSITAHVVLHFLRRADE